MELSWRTWRLAIAGFGPRGRFFYERWQLLNPERVVAVADDDPARYATMGLSSTPIVSLSHLTSRPSDCTAVLVTLPLHARGTLVAELLTAGLSVFVEPPVATSMTDARELFAIARSHKAALRVVSLRRSEPDYLAAQAAIATNRIGAMTSLRWYAAEYAVWAGDAAAEYRRGESLTVAGPPILDQLAGLMTIEPSTVWAREFPAEDGFAIDVAYRNGSSTHVELRRTARVGMRTGWIIEGETGSYHQRRLISTTADGELVDEAVSTEVVPVDPVQELEAMSTLTPMSEAEQRRCLITVGLFEAAQRSMATNAPVTWDAL